MNERERDAWQIGYDDGLAGVDHRSFIQLMNSHWINFYDAGHTAGAQAAADPVTDLEP